MQDDKRGGTKQERNLSVNTGGEFKRKLKWAKKSKDDGGRGAELIAGVGAAGVSPCTSASGR